MIAVLTVGRPGGVDYLESAMAAIRSEGIDGASVISGVAPQSLAIWQAMRLAAYAREDLILLEDDIELAPGAISRMVEFPVPDDCAFVKFCSQLPAPSCPPGLLRAPIKMLCVMYQAVKYPLRTLLQLVEQRPRAPIAHEAIPPLLPGARVGIHVPDLVRHVGHASAIRPDRSPDQIPLGTTFGCGVGPQALYR